MLEIINQRYMKFLFEIDNKVRNISELAEKADLSKSVASTLISRLVREGVVLKQRSKNERGKEILISLTEYGKAQVKLLRQLYINHKKNKKVIPKIEAISVVLIKNPEPGYEIVQIEEKKKGGENGE